MEASKGGDNPQGEKKMKKINLTPYIKAAAAFDMAFRIRRDASEDAPTAAELEEAKTRFAAAQTALNAAQTALINAGGEKYKSPSLWADASVTAERDGAGEGIVSAARTYHDAIAEERWAERAYSPLKRAANRAEEARAAEERAGTACQAAAEPILAAIAAAEGRASVRQITPRDIIECVHEIEEHLHISKRAMAGTSASVDYHAQKFPSAYRYVPESTHFSVEFNGRAWYLTDIRRDTCRTTKYRVTLSEEAKAAIIKNSETLA